MSPDERIAPTRDPASFRDPSGYVFQSEDRIYRAVDSECWGLIQELNRTGLLQGLIEEDVLVRTDPVDDETARVFSADHPGFEHFLTHDVIEFISYPCEWCCSMLSDAARHTLDLQIQLLQAGYSLKDASAYNIQFVNGQPIFIDVASLQRPARLDIWPALGQFGQMFTFPLLLFRYHGWDFRSYFLGNIHGRAVEEVAQCLGWVERWLPRYLIDVTLPAMLNRVSRRRGRQQQLSSGNHQDATAQLVNLRRLRRKIARLAAGYRPRSSWSDYVHSENMNTQAYQAKQGIVSSYFNLIRPDVVLDAGCNVGEFSYLAAESGARVIAVDADHDAIELLARRLKHQPAQITPIVLDVCNPSPPIGYLNRERPGFVQRIRADCVLALALIHHLRVQGNLSLRALCDLFARLTDRDLILEFVPTNDPMFERLTSFRSESFDDFTLPACRAVFSERFTVLREDEIPGSLRTLLLLRKNETRTKGGEKIS